jgi:hypothetical protein
MQEPPEEMQAVEDYRETVASESEVLEKPE